MAEASSSGGEASEEEDDSDETSQSDGSDEASPSDCEIAAASQRPRRHTNKRKELRYVQDYLQRPPKHQRKRIQKEINKGYKAALTVDNITSTLNGIGWRTTSYVLCLPDSKRGEITKQFSSDDDRTRATVREWLLRDPLASWRRVINQLYFYNRVERADSILHYAEELTDTTLTHSNLSTVLNHVVDMNRLMDCLRITDSVERKIREHSKNEEQLREECIYYWINVSPYSMIGWGFLGGQLHYHGQEAALRAANEYIQRAAEPTLTVDNLTAVLDSVQEDMNWVLSGLHIPYSKQRQHQQQYDNGQVNTARADYIIDHHPSPSWMLVADALWISEAAGALEMVQKLYLKDINLQNLCLGKLSNWLKSTSDIDTLPLPAKLNDELKHYHLFGE